MKRAKSPIRVGACTPWPFKLKPGERRRPPMCRWTCPGPTPRSVLFINRRDPKQTAILHPTPKRAGWWQVSFFDERGASRDQFGSTCDVALKNADIRPRLWRLVEVA